MWISATKEGLGPEVEDRLSCRLNIAERNLALAVYTKAPVSGTKKIFCKMHAHYEWSAWHNGHHENVQDTKSSSHSIVDNATSTNCSVCICECRRETDSGFHELPSSCRVEPEAMGPRSSDRREDEPPSKKI